MPGRAADRSGSSYRVSVVWLASKREADGGAVFPAKLQPVIKELETAGIINVRMVAQSMVNSDVAGKCESHGVVERDGEKVEFLFEGELSNGPRQDFVTLDASILAGKETETQIRTKITMRLGHNVVLGVAPSGRETHAFVVQVVKHDD